MPYGTFTFSTYFFFHFLLNLVFQQRCSATELLTSYVRKDSNLRPQLLDILFSVCVWCFTEILKQTWTLKYTHHTKGQAIYLQFNLRYNIARYLVKSIKFSSINPSLMRKILLERFKSKPKMATIPIENFKVFEFRPSSPNNQESALG